MTVLATFAAAVLMSSGSQQACHVALAVLPPLEFSRQALFASAPSQGVLADAKQRKDLAQGWEGRPPSTATLAAFRAARLQSALQCAEVREAIAKRGGVIEEDRLASTLDRARLKDPLIVVHQLSLPILGPQGHEALVVRSTVNNQTGGDAWLVLFVKQRDGRWREVGRKLLAVA